MKGALLALAAALAVLWWRAGRPDDLGDWEALGRRHAASSWGPELQYAAATIRYQRADYGEAQKSFLTFLEDHPKSPRAPKVLLRLSMSAEQNRDPAVEREALDRLLSEYPDHPDAKVARRRREMLKFQ